jgi:uncharacterized membrane protein
MKKRALAIALVAFLGMVDTFYLSAKGSQPVPCRITGGCNDVLTSQYSKVLGVPLSTIGLLFYLTIFSLAVFHAFGAADTLRWVFWLALPGLAISMALVGIQAFVLRAYCEYCLASAILETTIFFLSPWPRRLVRIHATER